MQGEKIILTTWWFDPVHVWHINLFQSAAKLWKLIVWLNSDEWLTKKRGRPFMNWNERRKILLEMSSISDVIAFDDMDERRSAIDALRKVHSFYAGSWVDIVFAKWWDRSVNNIPEVDICKELGIEIIFGVWNDGKPQSSSWLLDSWSDFVASHDESKKDKNFSRLNYWL